MAAISHSGYGPDQKSKASSAGRQEVLRQSSSAGIRLALQRSLLGAEQLKGVRMKAITGGGEEQQECGGGTAAAAEQSARDFGGMWFARPSVVVYPATAEEIGRVMKVVSSLSSSSASMKAVAKVAARGNGHSVGGQAQAADGVVVEMRALNGGGVALGREADGSFYADVGGGLLWIEILDATLPSSLSPRSFTDYLYLSVGGTLQNAGVGGQCFRHGPLISNVSRLDIITADGEIKCCTPTVNADLFYGSLGGLGQLGIISKARILLQPAPQKVRWIRLVYADFASFTYDQEHLITSAAAAFDYLEGFVIVNSDDPVSGWSAVDFSDHRPYDSKSSANSAIPRHVPRNAGPVLYCLEVAKYYGHGDLRLLDQQIDAILRTLRFVAGLRFQIDVTYREFLDRVHMGEMKLQKAGLWSGSAHPWLCLFVPRSQIQAFDAHIFKSKLCKTGVGGPILVYPMLRSKWPRDPRCCAVIPDEEVFYMVALLRFMNPTDPSGRSMGTAERMSAENEEIVRMARAAGIKLKRYLPQFRGVPAGGGAWVEHFGAPKWGEFCRLKRRWDPQGILAPSLRIPFPETV